MARFIGVGEARVNADRLLLIEPERTLNTGEKTGYAKVVFEDNIERTVPLNGQTVDEILEGLLAEGQPT
jgi:hypothetical protein